MAERSPTATLCMSPRYGIVA